MGTIGFIIWNTSPEIASLGSFSLRWYGLLFALGFLISQQIMYYFYRKEGKPESDVDTLTIYMVVATIIGARLGHVIFYQRELFTENPLSIILPFEFNPFRFTGFQGLASHGGAAAILFALWLYSTRNIAFSKIVDGQTKRGLFITKRSLPGQSFLQVTDRIVILVAITGALIRLGNYFNSEIPGLPTNMPQGTLFVNQFTEQITDNRSEPTASVESVKYVISDSLPTLENGRVPISIYIFFKPGTTESKAENLLYNFAKPSLINEHKDYFDATEVNSSANIYVEKPGSLVAKINTYAIARHPAQLYESGSCLILALVLFLIWRKYKNDLPAGRLLGIFLIWCFGLRIFFELLKEVQVEFEKNLMLNMGQSLSIPLVLLGIFILIRSFRTRSVS